MERPLMYLCGRDDIVKMSGLHKSTYIFSAILVKILACFFVEIDKLILKFI